jgi:Phage capsid protein
MTDQVPAWYRDQWNTRVIQRFQADGYLLKGMTEAPVRIEGNNFKFLRSAKVDVGGPFQRGSAVQPLNPVDDLVSFASQEWDAPIYLYDFDVTRLPINEADARQYQATRALGRKADHIIYDALMAQTLPNANQTVSAVLPAMEPYAAMDAVAIMFDYDVPDDGQIFCGLPAMCWEQMKAFRIFANSEYVGPMDMPFAKRSEKRTWNGVHWFRLPAHLYNYKTVSTANDTWKFRMWHRSALGAGHNIELKTEWQRQAPFKRWFVNHTIDGCCTGIQLEGIFEFQVTAAGAKVNPEIFPTYAASNPNY